MCDESDLRLLAGASQRGHPLTCSVFGILGRGVVHLHIVLCIDSYIQLNSYPCINLQAGLRICLGRRLALPGDPLSCQVLGRADRLG